MKGEDLLLILVSVGGLVAGQVLLKFAMRQGSEATRDGGTAGTLSGARRAACFAGGIGAMTLWFMLWLGLMQKLPLSMLFPFEALASILLALAASWLLRERVSLRAWLGIALIALGVGVVGHSGGDMGGSGPERVSLPSEPATGASSR